MYISRTRRVQYNVSRSRSRFRISLIQIWHGSRFKIPETRFFFAEKAIRKFGYTFITQFCSRIFFFFLPPYRTVGQHPRTARTYTLCIMYGGALKIYKYESHGGVVSVTSCPERCSFIHTRKKFQP